MQMIGADANYSLWQARGGGHGFTQAAVNMTFFNMTLGDICGR